MSLIASTVGSILVGVATNIISDKLFDKSVSKDIDRAYADALSRWTCNSNIRHSYALRKFQQWKELQQYILDPDRTVSDSKIKELLILWEEELQKYPDSYRTIKDSILIEETHSREKQGFSSLDELKTEFSTFARASIDYDEQIKQLIQRILEILEASSLGSNTNTGIIYQTFDPLNEYIPRSVYAVLNTEADTEDTYIRSLYPDDFPEGNLCDFINGFVDRVKNKNKFILYSTAQSGKTTELNNLAYELQSSGLYNVFKFEIKDYSCRQSVEDFLKNNYSSGMKTVFLIDGIDEVEDSGRPVLFRELESYAKGHPSIIMLLTCRSNFERNKDLTSYTRLYLNDLNWEDVCTYIHTHSKFSDDLIAEIGRLDLYQFTYIPFYLKTLISFYDEKRSLPNDKGQLYEYWIDKSFHADDEKAVGELVSLRTNGESLLKKIAAVLQLTEKACLTEHEMMNDLHLSREDISLCCRFTIFKKSKESYSFEHNAFREYFVSKFLHDKSFDDIKELVCYNSLEKVKPLWYNTLVLFLSQLQKSDPRFNQILDWLKNEDKEMLLNVDKNSIDEDIRTEIFKGIVLKYKDLGLWYSSETIVSSLMHFGDSRKSINFILEEIENCSELNTHLKNMLSLLKYVDYYMYSEGDELLHRLEDVTFSTISIFNGKRSNVSHDALFNPLENKWFQQKKYVTRLYDEIKDSTYPEVLIFFCQFVCDTGLADDYIDFVIEKEYIIKSTEVNGITRFYSRHCVNNVFRSIDSYSSFQKVSKFLTQLQDKTGFGYTDDVFEIETRLVELANQFFSDHEKEITDIMICSYLKNCVDKFLFHGDYATKCFSLYKSFFEKNRDTDKCFELYLQQLKYVYNKEQTAYDECYKLSYVVSLFLDQVKIETLFNDLKENNRRDYDFITYFRVALSQYDKVLYDYLNSRIISLFPDIVNSSRDSIQKKQKQDSFDQLFDYNRFRAEVIKIIQEKKPQSRKDLRWDFSQAEEERIDMHVQRFFYNYSDKDYFDLDKIQEDINNEEAYHLFLIQEYENEVHKGNAEISFSEPQCVLIKTIVNQKMHLLIETGRITVQEFRLLFSLLVKLDIKLEEEECLKLLLYSGSCIEKQVSESMNYWKGYFFFDYIKENVSNEKLKQSLIKLIQEKAGTIKKDAFLLFGQYIVENRLRDLYRFLLDAICTKNDFSYQAHILDDILKLQEYGKEMIKKNFDKLSFDIQLYFLGQIKSDENEKTWIIEQLDPALEKYDEKERLDALRILLNLGSLTALHHCTTLLRENPDAFGEHFQAPVLVYSDINALDDLIEILEIKYQRDDDLNAWRGIIYRALELIALKSKENLDKVTEKLKELIKKGYNNGIINYYIGDYKNKFYEVNNHPLSIHEALSFLEPRK